MAIIRLGESDQRRLVVASLVTHVGRAYLRGSAQVACDSRGSPSGAMSCWRGDVGQRASYAERREVVTRPERVLCKHAAQLASQSTVLQRALLRLNSETSTVTTSRGRR